MTVIALGGCATTKVLEPTGGSKADGTVEMMLEYGWLEKPAVDGEQARYSAATLCKRWGYSDAERLGNGMQRCMTPYGNGCFRYQLKVTYQCIN